MLSFLVHEIIRSDDLSILLNGAVNRGGATLGSFVGCGRPYRVLTEFCLGSEGFGSPDGAMHLGIGTESESFVLIEAKATKFWKAFKEPVAWSTIQNALGNTDGVKHAKKLVKGFHSTLNGQMELRWRFLNALGRLSPSGTVSERHVTLPRDVLANDVFYIRYAGTPDPNNDAHWRRVHLREELEPLRRSLSEVRQFFLLAITTDRNFPQQEMSKLRLFDASGQAVENVERYVFWISLKRVEELLERITSGRP